MGIQTLSMPISLSMVGIREAWKTYQKHYACDPFEVLTLFVSWQDGGRTGTLVEIVGDDGLYFNRVVIESSFPRDTWCVSGQQGIVFGGGFVSTERMA